MGDDGTSSPLAKKRLASSQISKETDHSLDNEWQDCGSFQKASEDILASRQILSGRRNNAVDASVDEVEKSSMAPIDVKDLGEKVSASVEDSGSSSVDCIEDRSHASVQDIGEQASAIVEDLGGQASVIVDDIGSNARILEDASNANVEDLANKNSNGNAENVDEKAYHKLNENLGENKHIANVVVSTNKEPEDERPPEALIIDAESHATDQGKETDASVKVRNNEQHEDKVHMGTSSTGPCLVKDGDGREEASEGLQLKSRDSHLDYDSVSEDKHTGSNEVDIYIAGTDDGHVKDAKKCEVASANSISSISIPPPGVNFSSSTFSFGTAPLSFATPTGFASFRNSSQTFGSTENATSGMNPGAAFSFKFSDDNPFENDNAPGLQLSSSEKSESAAPLSGSFKLQEVSLHTGEENETAIFSSDASLFEFASNAWKQRGKGELKINVSQGSKKRARMLMRMKGNYKLLLNANLFPDMKVTCMENRGVTFACINSAAEERKGLTTYALKFRDGMLATSFQDIVNTYKRGSYLGLKTPENSP